MNRMEEYSNLMQELDMAVSEAHNSVIKLDDTYNRAYRKMIWRKRVLKPIVSVAATFALFVLLVNVSAPVAYACSKIPILKELAEAVTFSPSLTTAIDHEYMQPLGLIQTDGDVEANIAYLIVDQKQVNIFYTLDSDVYTQMNADIKVLNGDGAAPPPCSYGPNDWDKPNGELRSITIDFVEENVPNSLRLQLDVLDYSAPQEELMNVSAEDKLHDFSEEAIAETESIQKDIAEEVSDEVSETVYDDRYIHEFFNPEGIDEGDYIAHFDFLLEFDSEFTTSGKIYEMNETILLDGQKIIIKNVEIYPSHMRVNIEDVPENTAWLKRLDFYIKTDYGMRFEPVSNGVTATGSGDSKTMVSFRADSSYFYEAKKMKLVITGAQWLRKDMEKVYINLKTGETDEMPEGVKFHYAEKTELGWILELKSIQKEANTHQQILSTDYYDEADNRYEIRSWTSGSAIKDEESNEEYNVDSVALKDYFDDEVWVCPLYSHEWVAAEPVEVDVIN